LRVDQQSGKHLLEDVRKNGLIRDRALEITDSVGGSLRIFVDGAATYDPQGNFLGADITLRKPAAAHETPPNVEKTGDAAATPTRQVAGEVEFTDSNQFLQLYFTSHIKGLYIVFQRLIGLMARDQLDKLINQTAQKHKWSMQI